MSYKEMSFSEPKQLAALGYALQSDKGFALVTRYVTDPGWFKSPANAGKLFEIASDFQKEFGRVPTRAELQGARSWTLKHPDDQAALTVTLDAADAAAASVDILVLQEDLSLFRKSWLIRTNGAEIGQKYDTGTVEGVKGAVSLWIETATQFQACDPSKATYTMSEGVDEGLATIKGNKKRLIYTGMPFLDEPMGGILPDDLVVMASPTGQGKTQLMCQLARSFASQGKKVMFLALEAGDNEIEMRILFGDLMAARFKATRQVGGIDFGDWRRGDNADLQETYKAVIPETKRIMKNISITYKKTSKYGVEEMERDIANVRNDVNVIIIDHLHYIDRAPKITETEALEKIMKRIRDINLQMGVPIILAAHVKKQQEAKRFHTLLPSMDDIYGSGSVSKNATFVVVQTQSGGIEEEKFPATALFHEHRLGWPTLVRVLKSRDYGTTRSKFVLVPFFAGGKYADPYVIGTGSKGDTLWTENRDGIRWAKSRVMSGAKINNEPSKKVA